MSEDNAKRLVVVSNRLPVALKKDDSGKWTITPGAGGLVSALAPVLKNRGGLWIGWSGGGIGQEVGELLSGFSKDAGYDLHPVMLSKDEIDGYYYGFSNEVIWPLFHDFQSRCNFKPGYWASYLDVNVKFTEVVARYSHESDFIWVHDYHLMHVAFALRSMGLKRTCGFFLHIPFPPPDIYLKLPWRTKVIRALLDYDLIGFQTIRDRQNFIGCLKALLPEIRPHGRGNVVTVNWQGREVRLGAFPISIDYNSFARTAVSTQVARRSEEIREAFKERLLLLGVDRLDYTKGVPQRLEAVRQTLLNYPDLRGRLNFLQILVPSREDIPEYAALKHQIEQLVGEINGQFGEPGYVPVHYHYRSYNREDLVAYYRAADMALVTPLRDGMNLVAKEYCASNVGESGVLFLSEFAGAAAQLQKAGAILVNPYDVVGVARAIRKASVMDKTKRRRNMRKLRDSVRRQNIFWWVDSFLAAAFAKHLGDFPPHGIVDFKSADHAESNSTVMDR